MKIEIVELGSYQRKIQFSVPEDTVKAELDSAFRDLRQKVRLQGFRPGKAPRKVLEMRFGARVREDVADDLVQRGYTEAMKEHGVEPVSRPTLDRGALTNNAPFEFSITVDVRPEIELEHYKGVEVVYPAFEVTEEEIDDAVENHLNSAARLVEVENRPVQKGDTAMVELVAREGEEVAVHEPGTMIRTEGELYYPGVDAFILGQSIDEERTATVEFPETARTEAVAGKTLEVTVTVSSIQTNEIPDLNDETAQDLGYEGGVQGMRAAIRMQISSGREEAARNQARANLLQVLIDANPFDMPPEMIDIQLEALKEELKLQQAYMGRDPRTMRFSEVQLADLRQRATFAAKGGLILDWVSKTESIVVTDEDIEAKYQEFADDRDQSIEAIRGYFVKDDAVSELRERLLEEKTLDWLLEAATIVEAEPSVAEETEVEAAEQQGEDAEE